jgi:hypothetical protein
MEAGRRWTYEMLTSFFGVEDEFLMALAGSLEDED